MTQSGLLGRDIKRVFVTGGAGFIGSQLCEALVDRGIETFAFDNFNEFYDPRIKRNNIVSLEQKDGFRLIEGDLRDRDRLHTTIKESKVDAVVHLAAMAGVRPSLKDPLLYEEVNVRGTIHLLDAMRQSDVKHLVFGSTSSVYGGSKDIPFRESNPADRPVSPYAATKRAAEIMAFNYHHLYDLSVNCLRFFTVYGPRQRPEMAIHKFTRIIDEGGKVPMFGDGSTARDYTFIDDILDGVVKAIDHCRGFDTFNLGESATTTLARLIELISQKLGKPAHIERLPMQPGDVTVTCADVDKAKANLGYDPRVPVEQGLERFIEWYRSTKGGRHAS